MTVTEEYITVWSSLNGMEVYRYKNASDANKIALKELGYINHSSLPKSSYLGHARGPEVYVVSLNMKEEQGMGQSVKKTSYYEPQVVVDLRNVQDMDKTIRILSLGTNRVKSGEFVLGTTHGVYLMAYGWREVTQVHFHEELQCALSFQQAKEFVDDYGNIKRVTSQLHEKLQYYENLAHLENHQNFLFVATAGKALYAHLMEFQVEQDNHAHVWTQMSIKSKLYTFENMFAWDNADIKASSSGRLYSVLNKSNSAYVILLINNKNLVKHNEILETDHNHRLHFLSQMDKLQQGTAASIAWNTAFDELVMLNPLNERGDLITIDEKLNLQTTGFFKQKTIARPIVSLSGTPIVNIIHVYGVDFNKTPCLFLKNKITK